MDSLFLFEWELDGRWISYLRLECVESRHMTWRQGNNQSFSAVLRTICFCMQGNWTGAESATCAGSGRRRRTWRRRNSCSPKPFLYRRCVLNFFYRYGDNAVDKWRLSRDNIDKERLILSWYTRRMCTIWVTKCTMSSTFRFELKIWKNLYLLDGTLSYHFGPWNFWIDIKRS